MGLVKSKKGAGSSKKVGGKRAKEKGRSFQGLR